MAGIWTDENKRDIAFFGFRGLPEIYTNRLIHEYKAYGFTVYKLAPGCIAVETQDMVVLTEIFRMYVPPVVFTLKGFSAISGNSQELIDLEKMFREEENKEISGQPANGQATQD